jgi:hypothetical protein
MMPAADLVAGVFFLPSDHYSAIFLDISQSVSLQTDSSGLPADTLDFLRISRGVGG